MPQSSDCLTLNVEAAMWERGMLTNEEGSQTNGIPIDEDVDGVWGVIEIEKEGVFAVHSRGISFLEHNSTVWKKRKGFSKDAVCGCILAKKSFVTIHLNHQKEKNHIREYSVKKGKLSKEAKETWPDLMTKRQGPGCGATTTML